MDRGHASDAEAIIELFGLDLQAFKRNYPSTKLATSIPLRGIPRSAYRARIQPITIQC